MSIDSIQQASTPGQAFGAAGSVNALAANYSIAVLWNASASKNLILEEISISGMAAGVKAQIITTTTNYGFLNNAGSSKIVGNAASTNGIVYAGTNATASVLALLKNMQSSGGDWIWQPGTKIIVPPGKGIQVVPVSQNQAIDFGFQWTEA